MKQFRTASANKAEQIQKENKDIYYYYNATIVGVEIGINGFLLTLDFESFQRIRKFTKRMIYGSLLVLSDMNFESYLLTTVYFNPYVVQKLKGKENVSRHDIGFPSNPNQYRIQVKLVHLDKESLKFMRINKNRPLQIFESKTYFEAYIHFMKRIQEIEVSELPFKDVLIDCDFKSMFPDYIQHKRELSVPDGTKMLLTNNTWTIPKYITEQLDESQLKAFELALSSKIALIQGPPGTGKTHVGTLLSQILLNNFSEPLLIVCFSNHALDQFLSHLIPFTEDIIRIGGRCKDEKLTPYLLSTNKIKMNHQLSQIQKSLRTICGKISGYSDIYDSNKILSLNILLTHFPEFSKKLQNDFIEIMGITNSYEITKVSKNFEKIYKVWGSNTKIEKVLELFIHDYDENYNDYWHLFKIFYKSYPTCTYPVTTRK